MDIALLPALSTYGRPLAQRDFGGFALSLGVHAPRESVPAHRHEDEYLWCLTLQGGFEETSGSRHEYCDAGSLLIRPPDCVHSNRFSGMRGLCLSFVPRRAWLEANGFDDLIDTHVHCRTQRLSRLGQELAVELPQSDASAPTAVESLVLELVSSAVRLGELALRGHQGWLAAVLDQIEAEPSGELRLASLARNAGVSGPHLARVFRDRFGLSVGNYVRQRRLAHAALLIRERQIPLAHIATAAGFFDQAHFTRAFKTQFGLTPAAFRKGD